MEVKEWRPDGEGIVAQAESHRPPEPVVAQAESHRRPEPSSPQP